MGAELRRYFGLRAWCSRLGSEGAGDDGGSSSGGSLDGDGARSGAADCDGDDCRTAAGNARNDWQHVGALGAGAGRGDCRRRRRDQASCLTGGTAIGAGESLGVSVSMCHRRSGSRASFSSVDGNDGAHSESTPIVLSHLELRGGDSAESEESD